MVVAEAKRRRLDRNLRSGPSKFVSENGTTGRGGSLHRADEDVEASVIECAKPTRIHESALAIHDKRVERSERRTIAHRVDRVVQQRSKLQERSDTDVALTGRTAPCRNDQDYGRTVRACDDSNLDRQVVWQGSSKLCATLEDSLSFRERIDEHT